VTASQWTEFSEATAVCALATTANAQDYPTRPITMVIPFAAGGPTDVLGRVVGARMGEILQETPHLNTRRLKNA
jgi:tripartite-type tricarboxylate transporter receptor subunit TctC